MRPRHLEIEAIGPFGALVEVDFDELAADGLFLIHGPTGAGKTSLLDGVCFALYGKVPGARGRARSDRSHFAARGVAPRAALTFDAQGGRYRVERTAAWEAPKARGGGTTPKPATAVLRRVDAGHEAVLASKPTEVDAEVERLLGLTAMQFQQVILLPQGKFERVLQANSKEREELFETLFDTLDFKRASEWLDHEAKRRRVAATQLQQRLHVLGDEAIRRGRDVLAVEVGPAAPAATPVAQGTGTTVLDRPAVGDPGPAALAGDPLDPATIDEIVAALAETADRARTDLADAERRGSAARSAADDARRIGEAVLRRDRLRAEAREVADGADAVDVARTTLDRAVAAEDLRGSLDDLDHRTNVVRRAEDAVASDLANAREAIADLPVPVPEVDDLDLERVPTERSLGIAGSGLAVRREVLVGLRATATVAARAEAELTGADERITEATAAVERTRVRIETFLAELPAKVDEVDAARSAAERLTALEVAATVAATRAEASKHLADLLPEVERVRRDADRAHADANDARTLHLQALEQYLEGVAAHLAGRLELDEACLVCGSHDHPNPAQPAADAVSEEDVERRKIAAETAEARRADLAEVHRKRSNEAAALRATADHVADDPIEARRLALDAKTAYAAAAELAERLPERVELVERIEAAIASDQAQLSVAESTLVEERARRAARVEQLTDARALLADHLPPGVALADAVAAVERARDAVERVADHAADSQEAWAKLRAARERADAEVAASAFADAAAARTAMLDEEARRDLEARISEHDRRAADLGRRLSEPDLDGLPDHAPDLTGVLAELDRLEIAQRSSAERLTLATSAHRAVIELREQHRTVASSLVVAERDVAVHEAVADRCNGRTAPRVPLQRWVLGTYLEEVCGHANRRLATMTSGRYRLLVTRTPAKANQPAGLDLRVHDANTNREREVSTLSGGETFQASLALALGVADSVEAHTGGVRLDALFVDEGFGTLDPDALELALDELDGLRSGGRMVGVISHVQRLRERIRLGAEVRVGDSGSTVEVGDVPLP